MPTLVATAKSATANSYVTEAEADTYFDERTTATAWASEATDDKERYLITATRRIDSERFDGYKTTTTQALKWPRDGACDDDGEEYDPDTVPDIVKFATYETALELLNDGTTDGLAPTGLEEFKRVKVGALEVERDSSYKAAELSDTVRRLLRPVIRTATNSGIIELG